MRVTSLGSGSNGNSTLVETESVRILVDAGFSGREIERRLRQVGVEPDSITAIVITHEHGDHTRGMGVLARRFGTPLYLTRITRDACAGLLTAVEGVTEYVSGASFRIGDLEINAFLTVHDAADPVAVTVQEVGTGQKLGMATDLGRPTMAVRHALSGCHLLLLEANHDEVLLRDGPYPWSVKQRIASSHGHLSNRSAAELALELLHPRLAGVVLAHLSEHCNHAALAAEVVGLALAGSGFRGQLHVASQESPLEPLDLGVLGSAIETDQLSLF